MASASSDITSGYNNATGFLQPFYNSGLRGLKAYQGNVYNLDKNLMPYNKSADSFYSQIGKSPQDFYNSMMSGYSMSPYAQNQMNAMNQASANAASASGMYGSNQYNDQVQQNANNIMMGDQQQYFGNMMDSANQQYKYLTNLQQQQAEARQGLKGIADYGYGAGTQMGNWSMQSAQMKAMADAAKQAEMMSGLGMATGLAGLAFI